jgi:hypothetical protein
MWQAIGLSDSAVYVKSAERRPTRQRITDNGQIRPMDKLTALGLFAVTAMLLCYALEKSSRWFVLAFAGSCLLASAYGFLQSA